MAKQKQEKKYIQPKEKSSTGFSSFIGQWGLPIIFVFSFVIYFNSVLNDYNLDDELVTQNHRLASKGISAIPEIFNSPYYEDKAGYKYEYRPVVLVSFAIEHSLFGDNAHISHFINVLLYSLLCILLFWVLKNLLKQYSLLLPFTITLLFAAHPIHTEVVASIKNRDEILALIFGLLSLHFATRYGVQKKLFQLLLIPAFFFLGILSKSTTITFALLIPITLIMLTGINLQRVLLVTITLAVPTFFYSRLYSVSQQIILMGALFISVLLLYGFKNAAFDWGKIKSFVAEKYRLMIPRTEPEMEIASTLNFSFLRNKLVLTAVALLILLTMGISVSGISMGKMWSIIPLTVLVAVFLMVREELQAIFITPLSLITLYALIKIQGHTSLLETGLIIFLVIQILSPNKVFRIIGIANYLIYAAVGVFFLHSNFFLAAFFFAGFINRKLFPVAILAALVALVPVSKHLIEIFKGDKLFEVAYLGLPLIGISFFLLWKQKKNLLMRASAAAIPVIVLLCFIFYPPGNNEHLTGGIKETYYKVNTIKAADPTPVQAVRPLKFIEYPLERTDPLSLRLGTAMVILGKYLKLIFVPYPLSFYYGYAYIIPTPILETTPLIVLFIHLLLLAVALFFIRRDSLLSFSILFYLVSVSVFSNLFIPIPGLMGDRFLLIPSIAFCFFVVVGLGKIFKQDFTDIKLSFGSLVQPFKITLGAVLVLYSLLTFSRNADWKDRITLFSNDIKVVENSAQAQNLLGLHLFLESNKETDAVKQKQMRQDAEKHLKRAIEIYPQFLNASFDLARLYEITQRMGEAYEQYARTIKLDSTFGMPYFAMAIIQQNKGNLEAAVPLYEKYLTRQPYQPEVYANLSYAYYQLGKYDNSIAVNKRALIYLPGSFEPTVNIAKTYVQMGVNDSAIYYLEQAQRIKPTDASVADILQRLKK